MNLEEFILQTDPEKFYDSSPEERLKFAQEYENMMAELEDREPCEVIVIPQEYADAYPGLVGYCNGKTIAVNSKFLYSKKPKIAGLASFGLADLIETLTHEGRHAWQQYVVEHPEKNLVDKNTRLALQMNLGRGYRSGTADSPDDYYRSFAEYAAQLVEIDARHFAMEWIKFLDNRFKEKDGIGIRELSSTYNKLYSAEVINAQFIVEHLDAETLMAFEEKLKKELFPGIDTSNVSMFADAIELLTTMDSLTFIDCHPVMTELDEMIDIIDGKTDRTVLRPERLKAGRISVF